MKKVSVFATVLAAVVFTAACGNNSNTQVQPAAERMAMQPVEDQAAKAAAEQRAKDEAARKAAEEQAKANAERRLKAFQLLREGVVELRSGQPKNVKFGEPEQCKLSARFHLASLMYDSIRGNSWSNYTPDAGAATAPEEHKTTDAEFEAEGISVSEIRQFRADLGKAYVSSLMSAIRNGSTAACDTGEGVMDYRDKYDVLSTLSVMADGSDGSRELVMSAGLTPEGLRQLAVIALRQTAEKYLADGEDSLARTNLARGMAEYKVAFSELKLPQAQLNKLQTGEKLWADLRANNYTTR